MLSLSQETYIATTIYNYKDLKIMVPKEYYCTSVLGNLTNLLQKT